MPRAMRSPRSRSCSSCSTWRRRPSRLTPWVVKRRSPSRSSIRAATMCWPSRLTKGLCTRMPGCTWRTASPAGLPASRLARETVEKGHGRLETRRVWTTSDVGWLQELPRLTALRRPTRPSSGFSGRQPVRRKRHYFISGGGGHCRRRRGTSIRQHWSVEVQLHWSLDVSFHEDGSQSPWPTPPRTSRDCVDIALMLLKQEKTAKGGIAAKRLQPAADRDYLLKVLGI